MKKVIPILSLVLFTVPSFAALESDSQLYIVAQSYKATAESNDGKGEYARFVCTNKNSAVDMIRAQLSSDYSFEKYWEMDDEQRFTLAYNDLKREGVWYEKVFISYHDQDCRMFLVHGVEKSAMDVIPEGMILEPYANKRHQTN